MAPKRHRGESSSSSRAFDKKRFVSAEAAEKFDTYLAGKALTPERGLRPDELVDGEMALMIAEREWDFFTEHPDPAVISIVKEFYANAMDTLQCEVMIRGKLVSFSQQSINAYYNLRDDDDSQYAQFVRRKPINYETIVTELCKPGTVWTTRGQRGSMTFPFSSLSRYGKIWYAFLCAKLMPSTHISDVTKERAILLYAIVKDLTIDVGEIIEVSIKKHLRGPTQGGLPHPSLICGLCWRAGVRWGANELLQTPTILLDHALIERYKVWEGGESHPRGLGFNIPQVPPQLQDAPMDDAPGSSAAGSSRGNRRMQKQLSHYHKEMVRRTDRIAERQEAMHSYTHTCSSALAHMLSRMYPAEPPVQIPQPPLLPVFPPPDSESSNEEEEEGDSSNDDA